MIYTAFGCLLTVKLPLTKVYLTLNLPLINAASYKVSQELIHFCQWASYQHFSYCLLQQRREERHGLLTKHFIAVITVGINS